MPASHVTFGIVDPDRGREAYQWHRGFAGANANMYARPWSDYEKMAERGQVMCATDERGDYLGLTYFVFEKRLKSWEIGGMMVSQQERGRGIGYVIGRVTMAHILFEEDPLSRGETVRARVVESNKEPRGIIESGAATGVFVKHEGAVREHGSTLPGVITDEKGFVVGDEYAMEPAVAAFVMAEWCKSWRGTLKDGTPADIRMRPGVDVQLWERAFRDMAQQASS